LRKEEATREGTTALYAEGGTLRKSGGLSESQLVELQNMRVLLEESWELARDMSYHRRARLEAVLGQALEEVDRQIEELRSERHR
jgi:hypothetical protein